MQDVIDSLELEISNLRKQMYEVANRYELSHPAVISISEKLDKKINIYLKTTMVKKNEHVK